MRHFGKRVSLPLPFSERLSGILFVGEEDEYLKNE